MDKVLFLVGTLDAETARNAHRAIRERLVNSDGIPVKWTDPDSFETRCVTVQFVYNPRVQILDGLRADAIFGVANCRETLCPYLKPGGLDLPEACLREHIVRYERQMTLTLNSVYGRDGISASERLAQVAAKVSAARAAANNPYLMNMISNYRKENENMSIPPYVMALANHQGPATIHAGGMSIPVKIMDIDSESRFQCTETSLRCMVVNVDDIRLEPGTIDTAKLLESIMGAHVKKKKVDRFAIKRVKLGKTPAIYWENGDKTSIVGPEWYCHSEVHAMAVLFNLRLQGIAQVIFNNPVTMVRCQEGDIYSAQVGLDMCLAKHLLGTNKNQSNYYDVFKKWLPKPKDETETPAETDDTDVTPEAEAVPEAVEEVAPDGE